MFNLFKKKYKPLNEYPESWSILEEKSKGLIMRVNVGYRKAIGHPDYPVKMGITIPIMTEDNNKLAMIKNSIEDVIIESLKKDSSGALVAVITGMSEGKFIEFLSYTKKGVSFSSLHQELKNRFPHQEIQMYATEDTAWDTYQSILSYA